MDILKSISMYFTYTEFDPKAQDKNLNKVLFKTKRATTIAVALVSGVAAFVYGYDLAGRYVDWNFIKLLSGFIFFAISTYVTDIVLTDLIQQSSFDLLVSFNKKTYQQKRKIEYVPELGTKIDRFQENGREYVLLPRYDRFQRGMQFLNWTWITVIVAGLYWFDYTQVRITMVPVANMVKKEKGLNLGLLRDSLIKQENNRLASVDAAIMEATKMINTLTEQISQTQKQVEKNNPVLDGMDKGKKNGWELQELARLKSSATSDLRTQLNQAITNKNDLIRQRIKGEEYKNDVIAKNDTIIIAKNEKIEAKNEALVFDTGSMVFWVGFGLKIIIGLIEILLVIRFLGKNPIDLNGDGEINYKDVNHAAVAGFPGG